MDELKKVDAAGIVLPPFSRAVLLFGHYAQNGKDHITTSGWNSGIPAFRGHDQCLYGRFQQQGKNYASTTNGYRDLDYMCLKIFNLPNNNIKIII